MQNQASFGSSSGSYEAYLRPNGQGKYYSNSQLGLNKCIDKQFEEELIDTKNHYKMNVEDFNRKYIYQRTELNTLINYLRFHRLLIGLILLVGKIIMLCLIIANIAPKSYQIICLLNQQYDIQIIIMNKYF